MAYRNRALSIAVLVAITLACNESEYKASNPNLAASKSEASDSDSTSSNPDVADHGEIQADGTAAPAAPVTKAATTSAPAPSTPVSASTEDKYKAMLTAGKVMNTVTIEPGKSLAWGTSATARLEVLVAVDANGAAIKPAGVADEQIPAGTPSAPLDTKFQANGADLATLHSSLRVCNNSGEAIYLHSGGNGPFKHGDGPIANATCVQFLADRVVATDGATYDHTDGNNPVNYVYLKVTKIGPDGKVVP